MKKNYILSLALLFFAALMGQSVKAQTFSGGTGTANDPYKISNISDWNDLALAVEGNGGYTANDFSGKYFLMTNDIPYKKDPAIADAPESDEEDAVIRPIGRQTDPDDSNSRMRFAGTFDGGGHTLNVDLTSDLEGNPNYCAPFAYCKKATIKNLKVTGTISTIGTFAGGLVGSTGTGRSDGAITIDNVEVAVEMNCNYVSGDQGSGKYANQAGFVGIAEGNATITNSWFSGKLTGADFAYSAGFIALNKGNATLTNCWFIPEDVAADNVYGSSEFAHDSNGGKHNNLKNNCYYTTSFSEPELAQGTKVVTSHGDDDIYQEILAPNRNTYYIIKHYKSWMDVVAGLAGTDTEIKIGGNLTAGTEDAGFVVNRDVTIDLQGYTIDRGLAITDAADDGYVIKVENGATLTLKSSGEHIGTITGGHNSGNGGGILNLGTLNLEGVTVTGNFASQGAGIYNSGTLNVKGNVQVTGNKKDATTYNNVYLPTGNVINVVETLPATASVCVTTEADAAGTLVAAPAANVTLEATNFTSDNATYFVAVYTEGENTGKAYLSDAAAITINLENLGEGNQAIITANKGKKANVTLSGRTLASGYWNTLCLPFDITFAQLKSNLGISDGSKIQHLAQTSELVGGTLTIDFTIFADNATIPAGTPFVVKVNKSNPTFKNVIIKDVLNPVTCGNITFNGTYDKTSLAANDKSILFFGSNNVLYYPGSNGFNLGANRAYFKLSNSVGVKSFVLNFEDEDGPTGIVTIYDVENTTNDAIYNLAGQRINKMQKGINIVNGKKVLF